MNGRNRPSPAGRGRLLFDTGVLAIVTDDPTNDVVNPLTNPVRAMDLKDVLFDVWLMGRTKAQVRLGIEFSNSPLDFYSGVSRKELTATYQTATNWNYGTVWHDLFNVSGLLDSDYKLYARLVALAKTTSASTKAEGAQIRVRVRGKPITPRSYTSPWSRVATKGSTSQNLVTPVTEAIATEGVSIHRVTLEMMANTGLSGTVVWQETDTPDDVTSWGQGGTVGSAVSSNGITFPGKPVSVTPTKRYMRYGLQSVNVSGAENESAVVRMSIEQRDR